MIKLKDILRERKVLSVFDFDDTIALTDSWIYVLKNGKEIKKLDPAQFAVYKPRPGETFDFRDFDRIDMTSTGLSDSDKAFYRLVGDNPFIKNVTVLDQYQKQGIATKLYDNMFNWLKEKGFKKVFSGKTRNSQFVNNIWRKYKDGSTKINGHEIYFKNL